MKTTKGLHDESNQRLIEWLGVLKVHENQQLYGQEFVQLHKEEQAKQRTTWLKYLKDAYKEEKKV